MRYMIKIPKVWWSWVTYFPDGKVLFYIVLFEKFHFVKIFSARENN